MSRWKYVLWIAFLLGAAVYGKPPQTQPSRAVRDISEEVAALRNEVSNLSAIVRNLQKENELLKSGINTLSDRQRVQVEEVVRKLYEEMKIEALIDQKIRSFSLGVTEAFTNLTDQIRGVINQMIRTLNTFSQMRSALDGTMTKNPDGIAYEVKAGETLDGIAAKFHTTREVLRNLNFIVDDQQLPVGQMLFVPQSN